MQLMMQCKRDFLQIFFAILMVLQLSNSLVNFRRYSELVAVEINANIVQVVWLILRTRFATLSTQRSVISEAEAGVIDEARDSWPGRWRTGARAACAVSGAVTGASLSSLLPSNR
jgi:hypothetical protein